MTARRWNHVILMLLIMCSIGMTAQPRASVHAAGGIRVFVPVATHDALNREPWSTIERDTVAEINRRRQAYGCPAVEFNQALTLAAERHSKDMATNNFFSHTGSDGSTFSQRIVQAGYSPYQKIGEILAAGYSSPKAVVDGWMNSPGHRAIITDCTYDDIGISLETRAGTEWHNYWTATFGKQR